MTPSRDVARLAMTSLWISRASVMAIRWRPPISTSGTGGGSGPIRSGHSAATAATSASTRAMSSRAKSTSCGGRFGLARINIMRWSLDSR